MGIDNNSFVDSPPLRPTPPPPPPPPPLLRRLSETNAATTLAFFKQQSPPKPQHVPLPPQARTPSATGPSLSHQGPPSRSSSSLGQDELSGGTGVLAPMRRKQKYTIKNIEAWGERHGRPAAHDANGRALWKRPSDGRLVYLTCPVSSCGKGDFVTLHGFMCHLTKKHKDRTLGSQARALEVCGVEYDRDGLSLAEPVSAVHSTTITPSPEQDLSTLAAAAFGVKSEFPMPADDTNAKQPLTPAANANGGAVWNNTQSPLSSSSSTRKNQVIDCDSASPEREQASRDYVSSTSSTSSAHELDHEHAQSLLAAATSGIRSAERGSPLGRCKKEEAS